MLMDSTATDVFGTRRGQGTTKKIKTVYLKDAVKAVCRDKPEGSPVEC